MDLDSQRRGCIRHPLMALVLVAPAVLSCSDGEPGRMVGEAVAGAVLGPYGEDARLAESYGAWLHSAHGQAREAGADEVLPDQF